MLLETVRQTDDRIVFQTGEWFDPTQAKSYADLRAMRASPMFHTLVTLWRTESGQWLRRHTTVYESEQRENEEWWEKINKKEAAARLLVNGYDEPEGVDYNFLKV